MPSLLTVRVGLAGESPGKVFLACDDEVLGTEGVTPVDDVLRGDGDVTELPTEERLFERALSPEDPLRAIDAARG